MVTTRSGHLLAVTKKDIHRSVDAGATWQPAGTGLSAKHVTALTSGDDGALYAGTDKGEVHLSQDEGATWRQAAGTPVRLPVRGLSKLVPAILQSSGHLPEVVVSSLAAYRSGSKEVLAAGTDSGVFLSTDRGQSWKTANLVLPKLDRKTGMAKVNVQALAAIRAGKRRRLYAGTDAGVFPIRPTPSATPVILAGLVLALLYRLFLNPGGVLTKTVYQTVVGFIYPVSVVFRGCGADRRRDRRCDCRLVADLALPEQPPRPAHRRNASSCPTDARVTEQTARREGSGQRACAQESSCAGPGSAGQHDGAVRGDCPGSLSRPGPGPQSQDKGLRRLFPAWLNWPFPASCPAGRTWRAPPPRSRTSRPWQCRARMICWQPPRPARSIAITTSATPGSQGIRTAVPGLDRHRRNRCGL